MSVFIFRSELVNINGVYLVKIYVKIEEKHIHSANRHPLDYSVESIGSYVKDALVYNESTNYDSRYVDLKTKEVYTNFDLNDTKVGELYINLKAGMIPVKDIINFKKENMSKRKILKKYKENNKK